MELEKLKKLAINLLNYYKDSKDPLAFKEAIRIITNEIRPKQGLADFLNDYSRIAGIKI